LGISRESTAFATRRDNLVTAKLQGGLWVVQWPAEQSDCHGKI